MTWPKQKHARDQRRKRHQRNERAFLFTPEGHLLGEVERVAMGGGAGGVRWETWSRRPRHAVSPIYPRGRKRSGAGRPRRPGAPTAAGRSNASAPEERQRPSWPRARSGPAGAFAQEVTLSSLNERQCVSIRMRNPSWDDH